MNGHDAQGDVVYQSPAYRRGVARAEADLAKAPPDDGTVTVSVPGPYGTEREYFKLHRRNPTASSELGGAR